jgi:hypothetical protein
MQPNIVSTASETNDTEDEYFGQNQKRYWGHGNIFPERSSNKFHPNTNKNLQLRSKRFNNDADALMS